MPTFTGTPDPETINGSQSADSIFGLGGDDILNGLGGNDGLVGGEGADMLYGGLGNDIYIVEDSLDQIFELDGEGEDTVVASATFILTAGARVEKMLAQSGSMALDLTGNEFDNYIQGNFGANVLSGGGGSDHLVSVSGDILDGGEGADLMVGDNNGPDTFLVDNAGDVVQGAGVGDLIIASANYTIGDGVTDGAILQAAAGTAPIALTGNFRDNDIRGNDGDNVLFGGGSGQDTLSGFGGNDTLIALDVSGNILIGGQGNDTYRVGPAGHTIIEVAGEGYDTVIVNATYTLAAGVSVELLTTLGVGDTTAMDLTGNELANQIWGNAVGNALTGGGGNDALLGFGGNDLIDGGAGQDALLGGTGDDFYIVDSAGDVVIEASGEGNDIVAASISYALLAGQHVELMFTGEVAGTNAINLTGNELANQIWGNNGVNALSGGDGNDTLLGFGGDDAIDGGAGADGLLGGTGNDSYSVDHAGDIIIEAQNEGNDTVSASVSYALNGGAHVELLTAGPVAGTGAINLTGNELAQQIWGNEGVNTLAGGDGGDTLLGFGGNDYLDGGTGVDAMTGGAGDDTYIVDNAGDHDVPSRPGKGNDRCAQWSATRSPPVRPRRWSTATRRHRRDQPDRQRARQHRSSATRAPTSLDGKGGNDILVGLGGADTFAFTTALGGRQSSTRSTASSRGTDRIALDDAVFTGLAAGALYAAAFVIGTAGRRCRRPDHLQPGDRRALLRRRRQRRRRGRPVRHAERRAGARRTSISSCSSRSGSRAGWAGSDRR